jgi:hypothetical protein
MAVTASNLPNFAGQRSLSLADLQAVVDNVRAALATTASPVPGLRMTPARPPVAHSVEPGGPPIYFEGEAVQTPTYFRSRPGLVQDLQFASGVDKPVFVRGHGLLPLAHTLDDYGNPLPTAVAGALAGVRMVKPEGGTAIEPRITSQGILELPSGGATGSPVDMPLAEFGSGVDTVPGALQGMQFDNSAAAPYAHSGEVYFPLAYFIPSQVDSSYGDAGRPGAVRKIERVGWVDAPQIVDGVIYLPDSSSVDGGGGELQGLADFSGNQIPWSGVGDGAVLRTYLSKQLFTDSAGHSVKIALVAGFQNGFLSLALEPW